MTWQGVPWAIGNGARNPVEAGRLLAHAAAGGREGVIGAGSLQVLPLEVPGAGFRIMPGAAFLQSRFAGAGQQAYLVRNPDVETVAVTPTGSSGGRTDLVAVIVEDPQYTGQPSPTSRGGTVLDGPYVRTRVYPGVAATTTKLEQVDPNQTGYALARYTLGTSDGTLDTADFVDLREVPQPQVSGTVRTLSIPNGGGAETLTSTTYARFPTGANWTIPVPVWAVKATLELDGLLKVTDDSTEGGNVRGAVKVTLGTAESPAGDFDESSPGAGKTNTFGIMAGGDVDIPRAMRGTSQTFRMQAKLDAATGGMAAKASPGSVIRLRVTFYEAADSTFWTT